MKASAAFVCILVLALAAAAPAWAGAAVAPVLTQELPNAEGMKVTAITVAYAPGERSGPHRHAEKGWLMAYVLEGAIRSQIEGGPLRVYHAGESWTEGPGAHHLVSENASAIEPARMLVVFVAPKDATLTVPDPR